MVKTAALCGCFYITALEFFRKKDIIVKEVKNRGSEIMWNFLCNNLQAFNKLNEIFKDLGNYNFQYSAYCLLIGSVIVLVFWLLRKIAWHDVRKKLNRSFFTPSKIFFAVVFVSIFLLYAMSPNGNKVASLKISDAVISTIQHFTFDSGVGNLTEKIFVKDIETKSCNLYLSLISLLAPVCTAITAIALIFKDFYIQFKYVLFFWKKVYILSELNKNSICLAEDIRKNHRLAFIIFAGVNKNEADDDKADLLGRVKDINALTFKKSVESFHFVPRIGKTNIYFINREETDNVNNGIDLFKKCKDKELHIHIFSTLKSTEKFIDNIEKDKAKADINLINIAQIIAYKILSEKPMFKAAENCGSDTMSVLVVGAGAIGMECAKAAMWCGVMKNFKFKIRVVDKSDRESGFDSEFVGFRNNLKKVGCDFDYRFYKADANDKWFMRILENCGDANYIIVATGNDELTVNTANKIRKHFIRTAVRNNKYTASSPKEPMIIPVVRSSDYRDLLKDDPKKLSDNIKPMGLNSEIFKENMIDNWVIEKLAEQMHEAYQKDKKENEKESYSKLDQTKKRSSRASAVHLFYKLRDMGMELSLIKKGSKTDKQKKEDKEKLDEHIKLDEFQQLKDELAKKEHDRWCIFQLVDGWVGASISQIKSVNKPDEDGHYYQKIDSAEMHGTIIKYEALKEAGKEFKNDESYFIRNDKTVVDFISSDIISEVEKAYNKDVEIIYK